ncbi:DUF6538 domain-containing protein [Frigidibacter sp. MR17.14]|uniref:DUF6538 domain-containing protein n=1 Tax=Frigidibacter sp. MR17.14 TaxID=3126509 RepID=UPI003012C388
MGTTQHLIRRGHFFHWRRRLPAQSTSFGVLQVSLRTTDPARARILARRLTAESDRMFEDIRRETLTPADARKWLNHVVSEEIARVRLDRSLIFADGGANPQADWAMATAWQMLAKHSVNAELEDEDIAALIQQGRSEMDIHQLEITLDMLGQEVRSEPRIRKMARAFNELIGREDDLPAPMLLLLRKLFIEGRAAAWKVIPEDQGPEIANDLAADLAADFLRSERDAFLAPLAPWDGLSRAASPVAVPPTPEPVAPPPAPVAVELSPAATTRAMPSDPAPQSALQSHEPTHAAPVEPAPRNLASEPSFDPSISAVIERLVIQKSRAGVSEATQRQYLSFGALFIQITGLSDVRAVRQGHVMQFRATLQQMPKSWGKSPTDAHASIADLMEKARSLPKDQVGIAPGTLNRHLSHLAQMLEHATREGLHVDGEVMPRRLTLPEDRRNRDKNASFRPSELERLFNHSIWQGCKSERHRNSPGDLVLKYGLFWIPLLVAYTGAEREELAALSTEDVRVEDGIHYLAIEENANRGVKNFTSTRKVPLHEHLIELGFLAHVQQAKRRANDLFPELRPAGHSKQDRRKKYGDRIYYAFDKALEKALDGNPRNLCLHSMRHYVRDYLALDPTVPDKVRYDLISHEGADEDTRTYGAESPLRHLQDAVNRLPRVF